MELSDMMPSLPGPLKAGGRNGWDTNLNDCISKKFGGVLVW